MSFFVPSLVDRIVKLGGSIAGEPDSLRSALGATSLPSLFTEEALFEEFDHFCSGEKRVALEEVLEQDKPDYVGAVLPVVEPIFKVFYYRSLSGVDDLANWSLKPAEEAHILKLTQSKDLEFSEIGYWDGWYPDLYNIFISDPNPTNPNVYSTDHEVSWLENEVNDEGSFDAFLGKFLTPTEVVEGLRAQLRN